MSANTSASNWLSMILPPERLEPLEVRLSDNSVRRAIWTGAKWWSNGIEVHPEAWRPLQPELNGISACS